MKILIDKKRASLDGRLVSSVDQFWSEVTPIHQNRIQENVKSVWSELNNLPHIVDWILKQPK